MSAKVYHFCQHCQQMISPSINDNRLKEQDEKLQEARHAAFLDYLPKPTGHHVWTAHCPKCGHKWPLRLLRVGRQPIARLTRVTAVLGELMPAGKAGRVHLFSGGRNYKKLQQAKSRAGNIKAGGIRYSRRDLTY